MKKLISVICLILVCFSVSACSLNAGQTNKVVIDIGKSKKFSKDEIQAAVNCVMIKFRDFKGCDLKKIWYDEDKSNLEVQAYMSNGKGSVNGVQKENVIVLFSNFYVNDTGAADGFNPNSTYTDWNWILIRDSKTVNWKVDDWGY